MKKLDKISRLLNDEFRDHLKAAALKEHGVVLSTEYSLFADRLITTRADGRPLGKRLGAWISAFELGYCAAWGVVGREANR